MNELELFIVCAGSDPFQLSAECVLTFSHDVIWG